MKHVLKLIDAVLPSEDPGSNIEYYDSDLATSLVNSPDKIPKEANEFLQRMCGAAVRYQELMVNQDLP